MNLSEQEKRCLAQLRRQKAAWPVMRYIISIGALVFLGAAFFANDRGEQLALGGLAAGLFSYSMGGWKGRPEVDLLLKVFEDEQI